MAEETKEVYIVTSGSYSDYRICAVFLNKEEAETYRRALPSDEAGVENWGISDGDPLVQQAQKGYCWWSVYLSPDKSEAYRIDPTNASARISAYNGENVVVTPVCAKTKEGAMKIANEARRQWKAEQSLPPEVRKTEFDIPDEE